MKLVAYAETHPGYVRDNNEDAYMLLRERGVFVVADGMAGHRFGELASAIAIKTVRLFYVSDDLGRYVAVQFRQARQTNGRVKRIAFPQYKLRRAVEEANHAIFRAAQRNPRYKTMGTTLVAAAIEKHSIYVAHVGDSRLYRLRNGRLQQLTRDHSLLNEYLKLNYISKEDARKFPLKNIVVRALGIAGSVAVDSQRRPIKPGDTLLLCSDGLSDHVEDSEIASALQREGEPQEQVRALIRKALEAGGHDNITALVIRIDDLED